MFGRKNGRLFCLFVCLLQLCPILAYFFLIEALIDLRKILLRKKLFDEGDGLGIAQPLKYSYSADLLYLQRCN